MSKESFTYEIDSKSVFDTDEPNQLKVQPWGKQGCDESDNPLYFIRFGSDGTIEPLSALSSPIKDPSSVGQSRRPSTVKLSPTVKLTSTAGMESALQERQLGSALEQNNTLEKSNRINKAIHISKDTKKIDELVAMIRKAKRSKGEVTNADILKQYKSLSS